MGVANADSSATRSSEENGSKGTTALSSSASYFCSKTFCKEVLSSDVCKELKIFLRLLELYVEWQLLMVDGNGILHPRGDLLLFLSIWKVVISVQWLTTS